MQIESDAMQDFYAQNLILVHRTSDDFRMRTFHFHDGYEIHLTIMDNTYFYIEDHTYCLNSGGLTLVSNNEIHKVQPAPGNYERYIISFVPEYISDLEIKNENLLELFINRPPRFSHTRQLSGEQIKQFDEHFQRLVKFSSSNVYAGEARTKLELAQLLLFCNEAFNESHDEYHMSYSAKKINSILLFIKNHPEYDLSLDRICKDFYISKSHLIRTFKESIGMTPNEYIVLMRVMKSRQYLKDNYSVIKTCELIGYSDESHFIRTFKKYVGITPKQYSLLQKKTKDEKK